MDVVIRCWWLPSPDASIDERMGEAVGVLLSPPVVKVMGDRWFRGGRTKKAALASPVRLDDVGPRQRPWRRVSMTDVPPHDEWYYELGLWNGAERPESATFSVKLHEPAISAKRLRVPGLQTDKLVLSAPSFDVLSSRGVPWTALLDLARDLASRLGGRAEVTGGELWKLAEAVGVDATTTAYAAFWGADRSGANPLYAPLARAGLVPPYSLIIASSVEEAGDIDSSKLKAMSELMGGVPR